MSYLKERISYIKGLSDGLAVDDSTKEGKLIRSLIDFCEEMVEAIDDVESEQNDLSDNYWSLEERVCELEDEDYDDDFDDDDDFVELTCPECGESIFFDRELIAEGEEVVCPDCDTVIVSNIDNIDEDEDL